MTTSNLNLAGLNLEQTPVSVAAGYIFSKGDGKAAVIADKYRKVNIGEKKVGKGKRKTVGYVSIPALAHLDDSELLACMAMTCEKLQEYQNKILARMFHAGKNAATISDIDVSQCISEWQNETFSAESIGNWFDSEVAEYMAVLICTAKGWEQEILVKEENEYIATKQAAYRASYTLCANKYPDLDPSQRLELLRVIDLCELDGPIVQGIRDKLEVKTSAVSLGF